MNKTDSKLETLKSLIDPIITGASPQKKKYIKELFSDIVTALNECEINNESLKAKIAGFNKTDEYLINYHKALDVLILMGADDIAYGYLSYKNMRWICEHNEKQTKPLTFEEIYNYERSLRFFEVFEERMPESTDELKQFIKEGRE